MTGRGAWRARRWPLGWRRLAVLCWLGLVAGPGFATAAQQGAGATEDLMLEETADFLGLSPIVLEQLAQWQRIPAHRVGAEWRFNRAALRTWLAGDLSAWSVRARPAAWSVGAAPVAGPVAAVPPRRVASAAAAPRAAAAAPRAAAAAPPPAEAPRRTGASGATVAQAEPAPSSNGGDAPRAPIGEAPEERTADEMFLRGQRVLLDPGEVVLDPGLFYARGDAQVLATAGAGTVLATVEQNIFIAFLLARYGLFEETELFASTVYQHNESKFFFGNQELSDSSRTEFGDVGIGLRRTVLREDVGVPDVIVTIEGRIPTGDSSWAIGGGVALVKSFDPAVLFVNVNYRRAFSRDFADTTRLEPENRIDATVGYALAERHADDQRRRVRRFHWRHPLRQRGTAAPRELLSATRPDLVAGGEPLYRTDRELRAQRPRQLRRVRNHPALHVRAMERRPQSLTRLSMSRRAANGLLRAGANTRHSAPSRKSGVRPITLNIIDRLCVSRGR